MLNLKTDHGAVGDGSHDDSAALAAAGAALADDPELEIPPGIFKANTSGYALPVSESTGFSIYGACRGRSIIRQYGAGGGIGVDGGSESAWGYIGDLELDGALSGASAIGLHNTKSSVFERLRVCHWLGHCFDFTGTPIDNVIRDSRLSVPAESFSSSYNINHACGTTLKVIANYLANLGTGRFFVDAHLCGTPRFDANIYEGGSANACVRTSGNALFTDASMDSGVSIYIVLTMNNPIRVILPSGADASKINTANWGVDPAYVHML